ncbi:dTDP-4-dehydrorhamnose 3,5-epimerase [Neolewinella xylanilytica]|uniref:dTDP-4-dehydrorhamnose 3,5-epimerase n=1 Tax=Neolewinella xylanilytica TaxID=1514080 RepID=A0A2S6I8X5_9BACT|nr:dTDP-4-dehydrorhamnose 3,5-epimerase [Neolewinella xylanilytica]PPK87943.1 dTDP-4-dehydrorhamnose 3,5-epimerase [Neolewinella xylanilytica]
MPFLTTPLKGLQIFEPKVFGDKRGYFFESYNQETFREAGIATTFVQDNQAASSHGVLRGMHLQQGDKAQAKLVRVLSGEVFDVTVDMRPDSPTYRQWYGIALSGENHRQLFVPRGFIHGYLVTSDHAVFAYKCDNFYAPEAEQGYRYDDPAFGIEWPEIDGEYTVADRDLRWPLLT